MNKEIREYKITCQGCGDIRFTPYFDFQQSTTAQKSKGCFGGMLASLGLSFACLPLGCCTSLATLDGVKAKNRTPEQKRELYFDMQKVNICKKCKSVAKQVEIITHNVND